ncbi:MAG: transglycosylase domain-containing protein [Paracoccaceae bacterium]
MENLLDARDRGSVTLLDKNGDIFAWRGKQFVGSLRSETVSPTLKKAIISVEDKGFYKHLGISIRGILGAIVINLKEGRGPLQGHGGSTITQQVAKLLCLLQSQNKVEQECRKATLARKLMEIPFSIAMEIKYSKDEILSVYLNRVYLGAGSYGFEAASQRYFNKSARVVNLAESAMLAGLLKAPSRFAPTRNLKMATERASTVLSLMVKEGYITNKDKKVAEKNPAKLSNKANELVGSHFANWIMSSTPRELSTATSEDIIINTTFDPLIQQIIESSTDEIFNKYIKDDSKAELAIVVMTKDGLVRAMIGGRDFKNGRQKFNRAVQALRQPGSAFKPFIYAAALDQGYSPNTIFFDEPTAIQIAGSKIYKPRNYTGEYLGPVTLNQALSGSINTVAVQLANEIGIEKIRSIAKDFGIRSAIGKGLAVALGSSEVTLLELTSSYSGFLSSGKKVNPIGWFDLKIRGEKGVLMSADRSEGMQVIDQNASAALLYMLINVVENGTGARAKIPGWELAGKTGTSQLMKDAWFIGFNSEYVCGIWMGYDDNTPLQGVTGGGLPAELWSNIIKELITHNTPSALPYLTPEEFEQYAGVKKDTNKINKENQNGRSIIKALIDTLFGN